MIARIAAASLAALVYRGAPLTARKTAQLNIAALESLVFSLLNTGHRATPCAIASMYS